MPLISADNASCWFSYALFAGTDGELSCFLLHSLHSAALSNLRSASYTLARCTLRACPYYIVRRADVPATSTSWTCSTSGGSYVLTCPSCTISNAATNAPATSSSGLSSGEVQTICLVIGCKFLCFQNRLLVMFSREEWQNANASVHGETAKLKYQSCDHDPLVLMFVPWNDSSCVGQAHAFCTSHH